MTPVKLCLGFVRYAVVKALGELGDSAAIPALEALLTDQAVPVIEYDDEEDEFEENLESVAEVARDALQEIQGLDNDFETYT